MPTSRKLPLETYRCGSHNKIHAKDCETCETKVGKIDRIERTITLEGALDAEQRKRLMEIADKCPVHRTLKSEIDIRRSSGRPNSLATASPQSWHFELHLAPQDDGLKVWV